ncbi:MAG: hypothetical protein R2813_09140 [Flavobacteriales bacterium]
MKKLSALLLVSMIGFGSVSLAQEEAESTPDRPTRNNVIKTQPLKTLRTVGTAFAPINLNLTYERVLIPKLSAALTLEYGIPRELNFPGAIDLDSVGLSTPVVKGWGISPQLRFYPGKKGAPRGFYLAADFQYKKFTVESAISSTMTIPITVNTPPSGTSTVDLIYPFDWDMTGSMSMLGGGIGIGTQWLAGDRVAIDVLWIGLGVNKVTFGFDLEGTLLDESTLETQIALQHGVYYDVPSDEIPDWGDLADEYGSDIEDNVSDIPLFGNSFQIDGDADGIHMTMDALVPRLRLLNFSIGVAF